MKSNSSVIDWLRFSIPNSNLNYVVEEILVLPISHFLLSIKGSMFPSYNRCHCFANIEVHLSDSHSNVLVNLSSQACRQYETYMSSTEGWHWHAFILKIVRAHANITRVDIALDIFDNMTPSVHKLQDYCKRGQLSTRAQYYYEYNKGRTFDGEYEGYCLYVGRQPQLLRIYDKKEEVRAKTGVALDIDKWIRWELQLSDRKAISVCNHIANGKSLSNTIRGILASHYAFKTQPKNQNEFHNKARWRNMKWWENFIQDIEKIPLRSTKTKTTLSEKKKWIEKYTTKSRAMLYEVYKTALGDDYAEAYLKNEIIVGRNKFNELDKSIIDQAVNELLDNNNKI